MPTDERAQQASQHSPGTDPRGGLRLGNLTIDLENRIVCHQDGGTVTLQEKPFLLLLSLLRYPGRLVTREELITEIWPPGLHVDFDHGLNTAVKKLRRALQDSAREPRFIETVPRRGYRLLGEVRSTTNDAPHDQTGEISVPEASPPPTGRRFGWISRPVLRWAAAAALVAPAALGVWNNPWIGVTIGSRATDSSPDRMTLVEREVSLAVMPLRNLDASAEGEHFVTGLTEEILTALGAVDSTSLRLVAGSSTARFRDTELPADVLGVALGADYLVTGSLRHGDGRSRVCLRLIHAATHEQRWSASYDLDGHDVLTVQSRIAHDLVRSLPAALKNQSLRTAALDGRQVETSAGRKPSLY